MAQIGVDIHNPGRDISCRATENITRGTFVAIAGDYDSEGTPTIEVADPSGRVAGVAKHDATEGDLVAIARGNARVVRVAATGPIAAFAEVEVGANGSATAHNEGTPVGYAISAATADEAHISLY